MTDILLNIFFAYSRVDSKLRERLDIHLSGLKRKNFINTWYDGEITPGTEWDKEIEFALSKADIILLLISADFIASDYCFDVEMKRAISRHEKGDAIIIPVILHPCDWSDLPFSKIQGLPQNGKAVTSDNWENPEYALSEVAKSIKDLVDNLRKTKNKHHKAINEVLNEKNKKLRIILEQVDDLKLDEEILQETISQLSKEKKDLEAAIEELQKVKSESEINFQNLVKEEQININKSRSEFKKIEILTQKAQTDLIKLETKKVNIENDIKRVLSKKELNLS
jgi:hypothetical protein